MQAKADGVVIKMIFLEADRKKQNIAAMKAQDDAHKAALEEMQAKVDGVDKMKEEYDAALKAKDEEALRIQTVHRRLSEQVYTLHRLQVVVYFIHCVHAFLTDATAKDEEHAGEIKRKDEALVEKLAMAKEAHADAMEAKDDACKVVLKEKDKETKRLLREMKVEVVGLCVLFNASDALIPQDAHTAAMKAEDDAHKAVLEGMMAGGVDRVISDLREEHAAVIKTKDEEMKVVVVGRVSCSVNLTR
jgi:hypothetical protein